MARTFASIFAGSPPVPERYGPATRIINGRVIAPVCRAIDEPYDVVAG
jgi:hypothetical protein